MNVCTLWWLRHCLKCQARKTPRLTVRWPIISMSLPEGPVMAASVVYFGPLPVPPRGNTYILLVTDRFSRRAGMFPVSAAEFTAEGTANILVNQYISLWGCAPYSRTTACSSILSFHKLYISCWVCTSLLQAPIIPTVTGALSGQTTLWPKCWHGRQRATRRLRLASAPRRIRLQQFRQRGNRFGAQRVPHG